MWHGPFWRAPAASGGHNINVPPDLDLTEIGSWSSSTLQVPVKSASTYLNPNVGVFGVYIGSLAFNAANTVDYGILDSLGTIHAVINKF